MRLIDFLNLRQDTQEAVLDTLTDDHSLGQAVAWRMVYDKCCELGIHEWSKENSPTLRGEDRVCDFIEWHCKKAKEKSPEEQKHVCACCASFAPTRKLGYL